MKLGAELSDQDAASRDGLTVAALYATVLRV
jgi:hypothetical protein